jgi:putative nucleotidyltransferase with HDIG domain
MRVHVAFTPDEAARRPPEEAGLGRRTAAEPDRQPVAVPVDIRSRFHSPPSRTEARGLIFASVQMLTDTIEAKDRALREHSDEVARHVAAVATKLRVGPRQRVELVCASLLHDVGKVGISERILSKPGPLNAEERATVEMHSSIGARLVEQVPELEEIAPAILHHHERWDGEGYPSGLRGEQIPPAARIIAVVDAFVSMLADRPYRQARSLADACDELERCAGTQFDPSVVRLFVAQIRARRSAL